MRMGFRSSRSTGIAGLTVTALVTGLLRWSTAPPAAAGGNASLELTKTVTSATVAADAGRHAGRRPVHRDPGRPADLYRPGDEHRRGDDAEGLLLRGRGAGQRRHARRLVRGGRVPRPRHQGLGVPGRLPGDAVRLDAGGAVPGDHRPDGRHHAHRVVRGDLPEQRRPGAGTVLGAGATASWSYTAQLTLAASQVAVLADPKRSSGIRNVVHVEVTPRDPTERPALHLPGRLRQPDHCGQRVGHRSVGRLHAAGRQHPDREPDTACRRWPASRPAAAWTCR